MTDKIIISLFDFSGVWSRAYRMAGYIVICIDSKLGIDLYDFNYKNIRKDRVHGILAAPPCTDFSKAGSCFWKEKDKSGKTKPPSRMYQGLLWEISGNGLDKPSYLYGTMHVSKKVAFHLSDTFFIALKNVDKVAL